MSSSGSFADEMSNVAAFLPRMAARLPYRPAIFAPSGHDRSGRARYTHLTYRQLDELSDAIATGLETAGVGRGTRTVLMVRPSLELFLLTFAMFKAGVVPVVVDPGLGLGQVRSCLARVEPEAFVGVPEAHAARVILGWGRGSIRHLVTVGRRWLWSGTTLSQVIEAGRAGGAGPEAGTAADDLAAIVFTSGSTGPPKGVEYHHSAFVAQVDAIRSTYDMRPGEVDLPTFPLFALFDPAIGMTTVVPDMDPTRPALVDPRRIIDAVDGFGVTNMFGSPALLNRVGRYGVERGVKLGSLKRVISAGAPVPAAVIERFLQLLEDDALVHTPYGATESLPVATTSSDEVLGETRADTDAGRGVCVGRPVETAEVEIIRISDDPVPRWDPALRAAPGEVGEIVVRGPMVTRAYFRADAATELAKIRDADGGVRHRMGDLGYLDDQGRLWFCGRKSQRVIADGKTYFTVPCESVFNAHPSVYRSALVSVSRRTGPEAALVVELEPDLAGVSDKELTNQLLELGAAHEHTRSIRTVLFHPSFPVDIRHNTKIGREKLGRWATSKLS